MRALLALALALAVVLTATAGAHESNDSADLPSSPLYKAYSPPPAQTQRAAQLPIAVAPAGTVEQVGHDPLRNRGMNAALAVHNGYAYVGNRSDGTRRNPGVLVVDVRDPAKPQVVGEIGLPNEGNVGESSREMRILPDKGLLLVLNHGCSELIHRCANPAQTGQSVSRSNIRFYDITGANAASPKLVSTYFPSRSAPQQPHEFFVWTDPQRPSRVLLYQTTPSTERQGQPATNLIVTDVSRAREGVFSEFLKWSPRLVDQDDARLHSLTVSYDGRRAYLAYLGGGFLVADTSDIANDLAKPDVRLVTPLERRVAWGDPGAHSAIKIPGKPYALVSDEVYGRFGGVLAEHGCPWGWVRNIDIRDETTPRIASEYRLPVNQPVSCATTDPVRDNFASFASHNPTLTPNLALITWHSAGFQVIDLADPANPRAAAEFLPEPLGVVDTEDPALSSGQDKVVMWSFPIVVDGLIYAVDLRNGLYILRYRGPHEQEVSSTKFLDGNSNSGDVRRFEYGEGAAGAAAGSRGAPPALPSKSCVPTPMRFGASGIGPIGFNAARGRIVLAAGEPQSSGPRSVRYCVAGGGALVAAFSKADRTRLVATSSRRLERSRVRPGQTLRAARRATGARRAARGLYRIGRTRFFIVRRGRVRVVGVAHRSLLRRPAVLRRSVRGL